MKLIAIKSNNKNIEILCFICLTSIPAKVGTNNNKAGQVPTIVRGEGPKKQFLII